MCSIDGLSFWGKRYAAEGALWGHAPSETARGLHERLPATSRILEIGFGYGREILRRHLAAPRRARPPRTASAVPCGRPRRRRRRCPR